MVWGIISVQNELWRRERKVEQSHYRPLTCFFLLC